MVELFGVWLGLPFLRFTNTSWFVVFSVTLNYDKLVQPLKSSSGKLLEIIDVP